MRYGGVCDCSEVDACFGARFGALLSLSHSSFFSLFVYIIGERISSRFRSLPALYILPFRVVSPSRCLSLQNSLRRPPSFLRLTRFTLPRFLVATGLEYTFCLAYSSYQDIQTLHYQSNGVSFVPRLRCFVAAMPPLSGPEAWQ